MTSPLVHKQVTVRCSREHAFRTWIEQINLWWPTGHRKHPGSTMVLEGQPGGRLVERGPGGAEFDFGLIRDWEPPARMVLAWFPGTGPSRPTEVEITFVSLSDGAWTRIDVVHRQGAPLEEGEWPIKAALYARSWTHVLEALREAIAEA